MAKKGPRSYLNTFWMILGTSKISLILGPIIGHFWARGLRIYGFSYTQIPHKILESLWEHLGKILFWLSGTSKKCQIWTHQTHVFLKLVCPHPKKDKFLRAFSKKFSVVKSLYFRTIMFWNYWNISKSYWIKNILQIVTYHLSKKVSPRTLLVFMENHPFENFSPHTFFGIYGKSWFWTLGISLK